MENCAENEVLTELGCFPTDPANFVGKFYGVGLSFIGMTALLFLIIGAYLILTSQGNPDQLRNGKTFIYYALAGLFLAIFGYLFITIVVADILKVPGFSG